MTDYVVLRDRPGRSSRGLERALQPILQGFEERLLPAKAEVGVGFAELRMVLDIDAAGVVEQRRGVEHGGAEASTFHVDQQIPAKRRHVLVVTVVTPGEAARQIAQRRERAVAIEQGPD